MKPSTPTLDIASNMDIETLDCRGLPGFDNHERVVRGYDPASGLRAFIAIHSTTLGPALGGCRMWPYANDKEALADVLRLSQGMSDKHAMAQTHQGGGKAVIVGDSRKDKTEAMFRAFGQLVDQLNGRYITGADVGIAVEDMVIVAEQTEHVVGLPLKNGGSGNPSPITAYGVFCGIQAAVAYRIGRKYDPRARLDGITVAVQGLGNVGSSLCRYLHDAGARLIVADVYAPNVERICNQFQATAVASDEIYSVEAEVFAPCALGGVLNATTLRHLRCSIVAGSANNQLASPDLARPLQDRDILYCVDYVINAGGIINISYENRAYDKAKAMEHTERIGNTLVNIFQRAKAEGQTTVEVANAISRQAMRAESPAESGG